MVTFEVKDMSCGHCVGSITRAVAALGSGARVDIDLPSHRVAIEPDTASADALRAAITEAGFTPVQV